MDRVMRWSLAAILIIFGWLCDLAFITQDEMPTNIRAGLFAFGTMVLILTPGFISALGKKERMKKKAVT